MIRFNCEKCGQHYKTDEYFPEELECKKCGAKITIPSTYKPKEVLSTSTAIGKKMLGQETEQALPIRMPPLAKKTPSLSMPTGIEKKGPEAKKASPLRMPPPVKEENLEKETEKTSAAPTGTCPNCGATLQSVNAVICIECGHNLKLGVNVKDNKGGKPSGKLGSMFGIFSKH